MSEEVEYEIPERIWAQIFDSSYLVTAYKVDPRIVHDNGKPVYEYVRTQPPTADAEMAAHELISEYFDRDDMGRLRTAIATALSAAKQQGRDEQREKDTKLAESHPNCPEGCNFDIAQAIRSNQ